MNIINYGLEHRLEMDKLRSEIYNSNGEAERTEAWKRFLEKAKNNSDFRSIISGDAPDNIKAEAVELLLRNNPNNHDLCVIICYAPVKKYEAWKLLLSCDDPTRDGPTDDDLCFVTQRSRDSYKELAREELRGRHPGLCDAELGLATIFR